MSRRAAALLLFTLPGVACSDDAVPLVAGARVSPELLDFGIVAHGEARTRSVEVISSGTVGLEVVDAAVTGPAGYWQVALSPEVQAGLPPGASGRVEVTFRGCPEAWDGERLDPSYDLAQCSTAPIDGELVITTNDVEPLRVTLSGLPGLEAQPQLFCPRATGFSCPDADAELAACPILQFGGVGLTEACDIPIEIVNRRNRGAATADLVVDALQLRARSVNSGLMLDGADAGFTVLRDGQPWVASAADPLVVPVPTGANEGRERLTVRFSPKVEGILRGDFEDGAGLKLSTNAGELSAGVVAEGLFPRLLLSNGVVFPLERDAPVSATVEVGAQGPGRLTIGSMALTDAVPGLSFSPDLTGQSFGDGERAEVTITLAAGGPFTRTSLEVTAAEPVDDRVRISIRPPNEGPVPGCEVSPPMLDFGATAGGVLTGEVRVEAVGFGGCRVDRLDIGGPNPNARDEFMIDILGCSSLPCDPGIDLCHASEPDCTMSATTIPIAYQNTDITTQDLAELRLTTNEPTDPEKIVVLSARDDPCLPPTPVIELATDTPCAGQPIMLDGSTSLPGGRQTVPTTIVDHQWSIAFGGMADFVPPNAAMTQFTPTASGVWFVTLHVLNDCGARSATPAQLSLGVSECD